MKTLDQLTEELSPNAKHAYEAYRIAFANPDCNLTVKELREAIASIYGPVIESELKAHFQDRINAVLPQANRPLGHP